MLKKIFVDKNGNQVERGDILNVQYEINNIGDENAKNVTLISSIDQDTTIDEDTYFYIFIYIKL
ncbi:MAG: hypothetical protein U5K53_08565 [Halanaerobiales bacterium]|nr:hypothetical protein [Halanaerobiales bacterium]